MPDRFEDKLVSVILPAYRRASLVPRAARSVLEQSYSFTELIVVDDGSDDGTADAAKAVAANDDRMKVIRLPSNKGVRYARNVAMEAARGQFVAFLDSDDFWLPEKLAIQMDALATSGAILSFTGFRRTRSDNNNIGAQVRVPERVSYPQLLRTNVIATSSVLIDRAKTGAFQMADASHDDYATWLQLLRPGGWAIGIDQDLMRYEISAKSLSSNKLVSAVQTWEIYRNNESMGLLSASLAFANYAASGLVKHIRTRA